MKKSDKMDQILVEEREFSKRFKVLCKKGVVLN